MTSAINTTQLNENFPTAGVDNDSQGFRTNFSNIKTNLESSKAEISDLQTNTAKLNADNDFAENKIKKAVLQDISEEVSVVTKSNLETTVIVDYEVASIHKLTLSASLTNLRFQNFPAAGTYGRMLVHIFKNVEGGEQKITISSDVASVFKVNSEWGANQEIVIASTTEPTIIELYTYDGGNTVYIDKIAQYIALDTLSSNQG
jgi:chromosomal replication initiation ATPase DnaA